MKNILLSLTIIILCWNQAMAQETVTVKGTVNGDLKGYNKITILLPGGQTPVTTEITNGSFEATLPFKEAYTPFFLFEYAFRAKTKTHLGMMSILLDRPGSVYIKDLAIDSGKPNWSVSGMKSAEEYQEMMNGLDPNTAEKDQILYLKEFIKKHPDYYASVYVLDGLKTQLSLNELEMLYQSLAKNAVGTKKRAVIAQYIEGAKTSAIGQVVKNFTLPTPEDKELNFSQLKGKYVILDFWASWCGPCRASFPHMKEVYKKYKGEKFEIYSISIDKSKSDWLKELKNQDLPWLQALDTKELSKKLFAVTAIPTTFLIDPSGKILMKAEGFDSSGSSPLEKKLKEVFGAK